ncbi:depupylase/deamidase Dop [Salsipaludibacter albus]|uniref:depupylase/deamidase Dop n=1 Tax=Salsipaludibacter albus TaxID=2849650 RepID=UPI001EE3B54D|nr:depupylase/deamidase Dop [Salsipaludibacter albus]MBY5161660.1 proteasome accessory factor PafA2 [Salsipaludibacter albus]
MGLETEYGITVVGSPVEVNPVLASSLVVASRRHDDDISWDYSEEHPLRDARDDVPDPHEPLAADDLGLTNTVLDNGARFYVDHAHPEYSTPEVATALDAVTWDRAGDRIVADAAAQASRSLPEGGTILVHKNNTDGKGAAYGAHENHLVARSVPFADLVHQLTPLFVSRSIYAGSGRLGSEFRDRAVPFQLSQRADFFEAPVGLETTLRRPIINTRDEPHADPARWRRLHVITGDATQADTATLLRVGVTDLVLGMLEDGAAPAPIRLADPVESFHLASHDLTGRLPLARRSGATVTALELQRHYQAAVSRWLERRGATTAQADVLARWDEVLTIAEDEPRDLDGIVDWATKLALLERYRERDGLDWDHPRLALIDLQFHDLRPDKGLFHRLEAAGRVRRLVDDDTVARARIQPPADTRAWFRGRMLQRFRDEVVAVGWDAMIVDAGRRSYTRIPMIDPRRGTRAHVEDLFARAADLRELLDLLTG